VIKAYGILALLALLLSASNGQEDYLGGGYVGSGDYGDLRQYFTDPIFFAPNSGYISPYPVSGGYQRPTRFPKQTVALGSTTSRSIIGQTSMGSPNSYPSSITGGWHLELSDGSTLDLDLYQSSSRLFGRGNMASPSGVQEVVADGVMSGNTINLDVIPESGTTLYTFSLDTSRLQMASQYTLFRAGAEPVFGMTKVNKIA